MKFPRLLLTYAAQSSQGGYENYVVNQSSVYSSESSSGAYLAFRGNSHWLSSSNSFDGGDDVFNGTNGPWISIQLPTKIKLEYLEFSASSGRLNQLITAGSVYASNDGSTWINIGSLDNLGTYTNVVPAHVDFTHTTLYDRYLLHITANQTNYVHMEKLSLFGVPEYDPEADGVDVVVKSVPNVPNTDWLEVYYDAKDLADGALSTTSGAITGLGGTTINGTAFGDPQVSNGAFVLDGVDDYITTGPLGFSGDQPYSISIWFRSDKPQIDMTTEHGIYGFGYGNNLHAGLSWWSPVTNGASSLRHWHSGSGGKNFPYVTFLEDMWNHVLIVYPGGGAFNIRAWLNGVERMGVNNPGNSTNNDFNWSTSDNIIIGDWYTSSGPRLQSPWDGKIANFRLFNRALTQDEIYQLYAYQKEYFGHGDLGMTLKAGRLGIGTSEPRAMLDVNGTLRVGHDRGASMQTSMVIADGGNVGIGTSNPTSKLHIIDDNADTKVTIRGGGTTVNDSNVTIQLLETAASFYGGMIGYSGTSANQGLRFGHYEVSSTPRIDMAIDRGTGNVGIGTTDPSHAFHVASSFCRFGNIKFNSGFSAMPSDASTGINMIGGNAGGAVLFVMTFHNGANDATATRMVLLRKRQSGTWTQSSTNTTVIAAQTASGTDGTLSFDTSNNILRYRYSTGGNSHFYVIEFDG